MALLTHPSGHCGMTSCLAYFILAAASSLPFLSLFSLDATAMYKHSSTMFLLLTMACNISPIVIFTFKSFQSRFRSFKYQVIAKSSLIVAIICALGLLLFFKLFFEVGSKKLPLLFLGLIFLLASAKSAYRVVVVPLLGHSTRGPVYAFILGEGVLGFSLILIRLIPLLIIATPGIKGQYQFHTSGASSEAINVTLPSVSLSLNLSQVTHPHLTSPGSSESELIDPLYSEKRMYHLFAQDESILPVLVIFHSSFFRTWMGLFLKSEYFCPFYFALFALSLIASWSAFTWLVRKDIVASQSRRSMAGRTLSQVWREEPSLRNTGVMLVSFATRDYKIQLHSQCDITGTNTDTASTSSIAKEDSLSISTLSNTEQIIHQSRGKVAAFCRETTDRQLALLPVDHQNELPCKAPSAFEDAHDVGDADEADEATDSSRTTASASPIEASAYHLVGEKSAGGTCVLYHLILTFIIGLLLDGVVPILIPNTSSAQFDQPIGLLVTIILYHLSTICSSIFAICLVEKTFSRHIASFTRHIYCTVNASIVVSKPIDQNVHQRAPSLLHTSLQRHKSISLLTVGLMVVVLLTASSVIKSSLSTLPELNRVDWTQANLQNKAHPHPATQIYHHPNLHPGSHLLTSTSNGHTTDPLSLQPPNTHPHSGYDPGYDSWIEIASQTNKSTPAPPTTTLSSRTEAPKSTTVISSATHETRPNRELEEMATTTGPVESNEAMKMTTTMTPTQPFHSPPITSATSRVSKVHSALIATGQRTNSKKMSSRSSRVVRQVANGTNLGAHGEGGGPGMEGQKEQLHQPSSSGETASFIRTAVFISLAKEGKPLCCLTSTSQSSCPSGLWTPGQCEALPTPAPLSYQHPHEQDNSEERLETSDRLFLFAFISQLSSGIGSLIVFLYISYFASLK